MQNANEKIVFEGKMIEIVHQTFVTNGKEKIHERGRRAPGVRLIIETPLGESLISKEQRPSIGEDFRLPGGKVFDSLKEYKDFLATNPTEENILAKAKEAAVKEGEEEIGIRGTDIELFGISNCGGSLDWDLYYFVVKDYEVGEQNPEDGEKIEPIKVSKEKLKELALSGAMQEDRSVAMILKYLHSKNLYE